MMPGAPFGPLAERLEADIERMRVGAKVVLLALGVLLAAGCGSSSRDASTMADRRLVASTSTLTSDEVIAAASVIRARPAPPGWQHADHPCFGARQLGAMELRSFACFRTGAMPVSASASSAGTEIKRWGVVVLPPISCSLYELSRTLERCSGVGAMQRTPVGFDFVFPVAGKPAGFGTWARIQVLTSLQRTCFPAAKVCSVG